MSNIILPPAFPNKDTRVLSGTRRVSDRRQRSRQEPFHARNDKARRKPRILSVGTVGIVPRTGRIAQGEGSVDSLYRKAASRHTYMRTDAVSELDKLAYMVFADELEYLLELKDREIGAGKRIKLQTTKLDIIKRLWEQNFHKQQDNAQQRLPDVRHPGGR